MALPLIVGAFLSFIPTCDQKFRKIFIFFMLYLTFWGAFQYGMSDYLSYEYHYSRMDVAKFGFPRYSLYGAASQEFLYSSIALIFYKIGLPFHCFFFFLVSFSIGVKIFFLKKHSHLLLVSILIYFLLYFSKDIMQLRASVALSIFLISLNSIINRNFVTFTLLIIIASGFHMISLSAIPLYFMYGKNDYRIFIIILSSCALLFLVDLNIISLILSKLISNNFGKFGSDLSFRIEATFQNAKSTIKLGGGLMFLLLNGFLLIPILKRMNSLEKLVSIIYCYGLLLAILSMMSPLLFYRFLEFYSTFFVSLVALIIFKYYKQIKFKFCIQLYLHYFYIILFLCYCMFLFIGAISNQIPEYRNILFEN